MFDFLQLVANENMKIYLRIRTWIMLGILVLLATAFTLLMLAFENVTPTMWDVVQMEAAFLLVLVTLFTVIVSAESVAGEFSSGTIKLLLIRPWTRSKILLSKYISLLLFALFFTVVVFVYTLLLNWLCFGTGTGERDGALLMGEPSPLQYLFSYYG